MQVLDLQSCSVPPICGFANLADMEGADQDRELIESLTRWTGLSASALATSIGSPPSTLTKYAKGKASTKLSRGVIDRLRKKHPSFPGWRTELPDQVGMAGEIADPNQRPSELVYVREVDISYAMGEGSVVEDYPSSGLVPFNLHFIRAVSRASTEKLFIATGHGDSMEPTLLRSDLVMIDTTQNHVGLSDQIWALTYAGGGMIKRLRRIKGENTDQFLMLSDNPAVPPQTANVEDVHIVGKVIWVGRRM